MNTGVPNQARFEEIWAVFKAFETKIGPVNGELWPRRDIASRLTLAYYADGRSTPVQTVRP